MRNITADDLILFEDHETGQLYIPSLAEIEYIEKMRREKEMKKQTTTRTATIGNNTYELTFQTSSPEDEYISVWLKNKEGVDIELEVFSKEYENLELEADLYISRNFLDDYYEKEFLMSL